MSILQCFLQQHHSSILLCFLHSFCSLLHSYHFFISIFSMIIIHDHNLDTPNSSFHLQFLFMFFSILCFNLKNPIWSDNIILINFTVFSSLRTISSSEYSCTIPSLLTDLLKHRLLPIILCPVGHSYISPILFTHCVFFTVKYSLSKFAHLLTTGSTMSQPYLGTSVP